VGAGEARGCGVFLCGWLADCTAVAALGMAAEILFAVLGLRVGQKDWSVQPDP
jgi:hypothetical protein